MPNFTVINERERPSDSEMFTAYALKGLIGGISQGVKEGRKQQQVAQQKQDITDAFAQDAKSRYDKNNQSAAGLSDVHQTLTGEGGRFLKDDPFVKQQKNSTFSALVDDEIYGVLADQTMDVQQRYDAFKQIDNQFSALAEAADLGTLQSLYKQKVMNEFMPQEANGGKEFGVAPWHMNPKYADDPVAQAEQQRRIQLAEQDNGYGEAPDYSNLRQLNSEITSIDEKVNKLYDSTSSIPENERKKLAEPLIERRNDLMKYYEQEKNRLEQFGRQANPQQQQRSTNPDVRSPARDDFPAARRQAQYDEKVSSAQQQQEEQQREGEESGRDTYPAAPDLNTAEKLVPIWEDMSDEEKDTVLEYLRRGGDIREVLKRAE